MFNKLNYILLEKLIEEKKIKQFAIAASVSMTRTGFAKMLKEKSMKVETLEKIAEILGTNVCAFFDSDGNSEKYNQVAIGNGGNIDQKIVLKEYQSEIESLKSENELLKKIIQDKEEIIRLLKSKK